MKKVVFVLTVLFFLGGRLSSSSYSAEPTSQGKIKFEVDVSDDAGIDTVSDIIKLKNIKASEIEPFIRARLSRYGTVQVNDSLNMIIVTDKQAKVADLIKLIQNLDTEGINDFIRVKTESIPLKYTNPRTIEPLINKQISIEGSIVTDTDHNALVITDVKSKVDLIKKLISELDTPIPQVLIKTKIIEIESQYANRLGIDWEKVGGVTEKFVSNYTKQFIYNPKEGIWNFLTESGSSRIESNVSLSVIIDFMNFLVNEGKAKALSSPQVVTLNNKQAEISSGERVYYVPAANLNVSDYYSDVGLRLVVTPTIRADNSMTLQVYTELGNLVGWSSKGMPVVNTRKVNNTIDIKDEQVFVLSGLEKVTYVDVDKGIPILRSISPWIFSIKTKIEVRSQMLVFITPSIVKSDKESAAVESLKKLEDTEKSLKISK